MGRCDYNVIFYRVFCLTLLAIALIFTIILTNVFIDIDGLLKKKVETKTDIFATEKININVIPEDANTEEIYKEERNYEVQEDTRVKRSAESAVVMETPEFLFHIKNPFMKNVLKNRLSTLLEELDQEESKKEVIDEKVLGEKKEEKDVVDVKGVINIKEHEKEVDGINDEKRRKNGEIEVFNVNEMKVKQDKNYDMLHLAMHNILLQGIIGHMDLSDVYKKVNALMEKVGNKERKEEVEGEIHHKKATHHKEIEPTHNNYQKEETKFFDELANCKDLKRDIEQNSHASGEKEGTTERNFLIKTLIDIKSLNRYNDTNPLQLKGVVKMIYNGRPVKIDHNSEEIESEKKDNKEELEDKQVNKRHADKTHVKTLHEYDLNNLGEIFDQKNIGEQKKFLDNILKKYFEIYKLDNKEKKRLKRSIQVKNVIKNNTTHKHNGDDLFVEIETHFDSKGLNGEKKKKLIRRLIEKIQKAITHAEPEAHKKKYKHLHVKKRQQNPLDIKHKAILINKQAPLEVIFHRQLNPMGKLVTNEEVPDIDKYGTESWKRPYRGPGFLNAEKSLNSAQLAEVDVDYNKVMSNGIPQRLQKPLNTDTSNEIRKDNYFDFGNMKFIIKDDGSGFSVGFNQYTDQAPDDDTINTFSGVESLMKAYNSYDVNTEKVNENMIYDEVDSVKYNHNIIRRSVDDSDSYKPKDLFNSNFLPYDTYLDVLGKKPLKTKVESKDKIILRNILYKELKPGEIFSLANMLDRKKRTVVVKKFSNIMSKKLKVNRYLNTNKKSKKVVKYINNKRTKRDLENLHITANEPRQSDENIYIVSDENVQADRAMITEVQNADFDVNHVENDELPDYTNPLDFFDSKARHNMLTAKYPHIFRDNTNERREVPNFSEIFSSPVNFHVDRSAMREHFQNEFETQKADSERMDFPVPAEKYDKYKYSLTTEGYYASDVPPLLPMLDNIIQSPITKYKFTVKFNPENDTGFKEIHTTINKSFNKDGVIYSSLVNVSEISRIGELDEEKIKNMKITKKQPRHVEREKTTTKIPNVLKIEHQKINNMIEKHQKRLDDHMKHLQDEKSKLEKLIVNNNNNDKNSNNKNNINNNSNDNNSNNNEKDSNELVGIVLPNDPLNKIHLRRGDVNKLAATAITLLQDSNRSVNITKPVEKITTTTEDPITKERIQLIKSIEYNGNLTKAILTRIDANTEILKNFLTNLTRSVSVKDEAGDPKKIFKYVHFDQKNSTKHGIPFVYAYERPFTLNNPQEAPMASIVYQGHIRTNKPMGKYIDILSKHNESNRFFIDSMDNTKEIVAFAKARLKN